MELSLWWPFYEKIVSHFSFSVERDRQARNLISNIIGENYVRKKDISSLIREKNVVVFGAGPSLEEDIEILAPYARKLVLISSDGASIALLKAGIMPDVVVTDLDGLGDMILKLKSKLVVHAHGDNLELVERIVPRISTIHATTQVEPLYNVFNYSGFTDGDRAVFLADEFNAKTIILAGMDFGEEIGKYSNPRSRDLKIEKLRFGKELLEFLAKRRKGLYNITSFGHEIHGFTKIDAEKVKEIVKS